MSTLTTEEAVNIVSDSLEEAGAAAAKSSHKLLKFVILLGIIGIVFAVVRQMTSDSAPEPYEPAG